MNKLEATFAGKKSRVLTIYCTAGFPRIDSLPEVLSALETSGVDIIEVGIPYSDPIADGPVIQHSNGVALANGMNMQLLLDQLKSCRDRITVPILLMGYFNSLLQFGIEKFCAAAAEAGVSGLIIPDLPPEDFSASYQKIFAAHGLHFVFLVTPQTSPKRMKQLDRLSSGFLYAVSSSTITGGDSVNRDTEYFERLRDTKFRNPVMIGFGIRDGGGFREVCEYVAGGIIGSAYIRALETADDIGAVTSAFVSSIRS